MPHDLLEIRYSTGEIAQTGDRVIDNGFSAVVKEVVLTAEAMEFLGTDAPGLLLDWEIGLPVFRPVTSEAWGEITFVSRGT